MNLDTVCTPCTLLPVPLTRGSEQLRATRPLGEMAESWLGAEEAPRVLKWTLLPQRAL